MTEPQEAPAVAPGDEKEIDFHGRKLWVRMPSAEMLLVWKRVLTRLQQIEGEKVGADELLNALERGRKIIDSVLVNRADRDWLDDQMLDEALTFEQVASLIVRTAEAFQTEPANREERRAADKAPAKKAARKRAPRKVAS